MSVTDIRQSGLLARHRWLRAAVRTPYRETLRLRSKWRGLVREIDGTKLRWWYPYSEYNLDFERPVLATFKQIVQPGDVVFDLGANFGLFTVYAAKLVGETGRVVAFEPSPKAASTLLAHSYMNRVSDWVQINRVLVGGKKGRAELWQPADTTFSSMSRDAALRGTRGRRLKSVVAPMTTLDAFCEQHDFWPDVVKIDVEGAEGQVLRGAREFLVRRHGHVLLELHPAVLRDMGEEPEAVLRELKQAGWRGERIFQRGDVDNPDATVHYLFGA